MPIMKNTHTKYTELQRLEAVKALNILDTYPEERFDRITRMARRLLDVPVALISLVDENRQWIKSSAGIDIREIPREVSLSSYAVLNDDVFIVSDVSNDDRFSENQLLKDFPNACFCLDFPLRSKNGEILGTLSILDNKPRELSEDATESLQDIAQTVERELLSVQLAAIDELSGIPNKRGFDMLAEHSMNLCVRQGYKMSIAYFDLDDLKSINKKYGYAQGDRVITTFANLLCQTCRGTDLVARIGGDGFVVLFINNHDIEKTIQRLKQSLNYHQDTDKTLESNIEFSYSVTEFDSSKHSSIDDLLVEVESTFNHSR